ncbi:MAG: enoyl-CoA hydratase-related protein, partial [Chloroflexota bacterium]|nr:enoyl-CoA hydratase-related protein [Chloroflexota bacterium]
MSDWILVDKAPPLATITINRPETRNAINYQMWGELSNLFLDLDDDKDFRVIIITGAGCEAFS